MSLRYSVVLKRNLLLRQFLRRLPILRVVLMFDLLQHVYLFLFRLTIHDSRGKSSIFSRALSIYFCLAFLLFFFFESPLISLRLFLDSFFIITILIDYTSAIFSYQFLLWLHFFLLTSKLAVISLRLTASFILKSVSSFSSRYFLNLSFIIIDLEFTQRC